MQNKKDENRFGVAFNLMYMFHCVSALVFQEVTTNMCMFVNICFCLKNTPQSNTKYKRLLFVFIEVRYTLQTLVVYSSSLVGM